MDKIGVIFGALCFLAAFDFVWLITWEMWRQKHHDTLCRIRAKLEDIHARIDKSTD